MAYNGPGGDAANHYYNAGPPPNQQPYGQPPPPPPPQYGGQYQDGAGEKPTFEQTFKVEGPKYNDIWAGALVSTLCFLLPASRAREGRRC